ncbi:Alpha/Beta hydrolase protein, partial [Blyttiomyces helicus]
MLKQPVDYETFALGDFALQEGQTLRNAWLAYKTYGSPDKPCIVFPTWYSGTHKDNEWLIGPNLTLNTNDYFIVCPNMFGNGLSPSPSN